MIGESMITKGVRLMADDTDRCCVKEEEKETKRGKEKPESI